MKLVMLKGLPASGKSTRAKEIVETGDWVRVNRDLLREMLHFGKWSGRNEGKVVEAEKAIALAALAAGHNVVVDDCNLNPKNRDMWVEVAKSADAKFETEAFNTSVLECVQRDRLREKRVGDHVIRNMALQYGLFPKPAKGFVLCDLDGTLFDITHRLHYAKGETKDWGRFFAGIPEDEVRTHVVDMLLDYESQGHEIIFVSARPERTREATEAMIEKAFKGYEIGKTLIMRADGDSRDDVLVKGDFYTKYFEKKYPIHCVIDDRPKVIRMWRALGLEVIDVGQGEEF